MSPGVNVFDDGCMIDWIECMSEYMYVQYVDGHISR